MNLVNLYARAAAYTDAYTRYECGTREWLDNTRAVFLHELDLLDLDLDLVLGSATPEEAGGGGDGLG